MTCLQRKNQPTKVLPQLFFLGISIIVIWQFAFKVSNAAITTLLHFLRWFTIVIGQAFLCNPIQEMGNSIPMTLQSALENNDFLKYVVHVCPSCDSIYEYNDCVEVIRRNGQKESKRCQHVHFPNHPHASRRKPCEAILLSKTGVHSVSS